MPTFKCENEECKDFGKEELFPNVRFIYNEETKKLESDKAPCPTCNTIRKTVREKGDIKMPWFKAENAKNYNNKTVKQYDYDRDAATEKSGGKLNL